MILSLERAKKILNYYYPDTDCIMTSKCTIGGVSPRPGQKILAWRKMGTSRRAKVCIGVYTSSPPTIDWNANIDDIDVLYSIHELFSQENYNVTVNENYVIVTLSIKTWDKSLLLTLGGMFIFRHFSISIDNNNSILTIHLG